MSEVLASVTTVSTKLFEIVGTAVTTVTSNPLLLVFFTISIIGCGVGLFQRLRG